MHLYKRRSKSKADGWGGRARKSRGEGHGPERESKAHFVNFKTRDSRGFDYSLLRDNQCPSSLCAPEALGNLSLGK